MAFISCFININFKNCHMVGTFFLRNRTLLFSVANRSTGLMMLAEITAANNRKAISNFFILITYDSSNFSIKLPITKLLGIIHPGCRRFTDIYTPIMDFEDGELILWIKELYL